MSNTDEEIVDRVLEGLRDAAPPTGMESRIASAVRQRASPMPAPSPLPWRKASLMGGVALAGLICALFFTAHPKTLQTPLPPSQAGHMQAANALARPLQTKMRKRPQPAPLRTPLPATSSSSPLKEDMAAVSYPAPPLPLTDQEKLLLRLAHKGDPVQLAMLNPAQREASYADERAQVQQFFTPPKQEIPSEP